MPSLSAFQNMQRQDSDGIQSWLLAHTCRHQTYAYAASKAGTATPPYDFRTYPDDGWFARHSSSHLALQSFMVPDRTVDLTVLQNYRWDDDQSFATFMQMHTLIHLRLDQHFGIRDA